MENKQYTS